MTKIKPLSEKEALKSVLFGIDQYPNGSGAWKKAYKRLKEIEQSEDAPLIEQTVKDDSVSEAEMQILWDKIMAGKIAYAVNEKNTKFNILIDGKAYCGTIKEDKIVIRKSQKPNL